jgi:hypothetical protein
VPLFGRRNQQPDEPLTHRVEIWHVHGRKLDDYYVSRCDCEWIGAAHGADEPNAEAMVRAEAATHSANVVPDIVDMDL